VTLDILTEDKIVIKKKVSTWSEAIEIAAQPLLDNHSINNNYVSAMIESVNEMGPYIVIAPEIAIAHARPDNNVKEVGLSLLKLHQHINFAEDSHYASLIFVLSAIDNTSHLTILQSLASALGNQAIVNQLVQAENKEDILKLLKEND
jgi:PTS system ascorbate-specific IIA component